MKIVIAYHSGVGNTKIIAEVYAQLLYEAAYVTLFNIHSANTSLPEADYYIFAFPTYHCDVSNSMKKFIELIPTFEDKKKAFVFSTCGLYSANTNRIFIRKINKHNVAVGNSRTYKSPATDGILLFPKLKFQQTYSKNLAKKIKADIEWIKHDIKDENFLNNVPRFKLYSILNYPNKFIAKHFYQPTIYINDDKCIHCNQCVKQCPTQALKQVEKSKLQFDKGSCENCYRCIHQCQKGALSLKKDKSHPICFNQEFYETKKNELLKQIKLM